MHYFCDSSSSNTTLCFLIMSFESWILFTYVTILMHTCCFNCKNSDEIVNLPDQPPANFKQFAGYIPIDDDAQQRFMFYYFVEAESDPSSKPLVLWFNGGPGCSSVGAGAFVEHGPFKPKGDVLVKNNCSWNKEANMLYLETPAGVGFSYSLDKSYYTSANDVHTAGDNLVFLEKWFEKYREYKDRDFYIMGESYGGHYVPQLATLIVHSKAKINLKGIALGNPLLEFNTDFNSRGEYLWSHGLISDDTYDMFKNVCNYSTIRRQDNFNAVTPRCAVVANQASKEISDYIDTYDVTLDICLSNIFSQSQVLDRNPDPEAKVDVCVEDETTKYFNRKDVQTALNARLVGVKEWSVCSSVLTYDMANMEEPMTPVLAFLLKSGIRVFVYSGDQDSVLPLTGTRLVVNGLAKKLGLSTTLPYRAWFSDNNQVGGWTQVYGDVLHFATVRGAAHEAPYTQPERSFVLFKAFLAGKPLPHIEENDQNMRIVMPNI
ncbi:putative carboxypeptidase D [Helianthus annuus]|nr:putative carboxypeptidase D [Helianthus annuus]